MNQEFQYLNLLQDILDNGMIHKNRTGIDTIRVFGRTCRYNIENEFPLLTTKKVYWKGVVHELLWFLSGSTNIKYLNENNVHIWDPNAKDYASKNNVEDGELGPVYGYQWRNFDGDSQRKGADQIANLINDIKNSPDSRRLIVSAWNPNQLEQMALPPCHVFSHFMVNGGKLSCIMYQRSCDSFLGVPFNIASYALLTYLIAHVTGLKPYEFIHMMGDAHIYVNHIDQVKEQLSREPYPLPTVKINPEAKDIFNIKYEDIQLENYQCHPAIKGDMAV